MVPANVGLRFKAPISASEGLCIPGTRRSFPKMKHNYRTMQISVFRGSWREEPPSCPALGKIRCVTTITQPNTPVGCLGMVYMYARVRPGAKGEEPSPPHHTHGRSTAKAAIPWNRERRFCRQQTRDVSWHLFSACHLYQPNGQAIPWRLYRGKGHERIRVGTLMRGSDDMPQ